MKKTIILIVAMAFATTAFSQFGIQVGGNLSTFSGNTTFNKVILGYQIGGIKDFGEWHDRFSIEPGLFLIHKGGRSNTVTQRLNYLQIPVNTNVNFYFGDTRLYMGYGIYVACGLWGSTKIGKESHDISFGKEKDFKRLDFGGQLFLGTQTGRIGGKFTYQPGARAIDRRGVFNSSYMLCLTYLFSDPH